MQIVVFNALSSSLPHVSDDYTFHIPLKLYCMYYSIKSVAQFGRVQGIFAESLEKMTHRQTHTQLYSSSAVLKETCRKSKYSSNTNDWWMSFSSPLVSSFARSHAHSSIFAMFIFKFPPFVWHLKISSYVTWYTIFAAEK